MILNTNSVSNTTCSSQNYNNALSNLDVPKLRDLKSHSFPPPFTNSSETNSQLQTITSTIVNNMHHQTSCHGGYGAAASGSAGSSVASVSSAASAASTGGCCSETTTSSSSFADAPINSLTDSSNSPTSQDYESSATDERRKRWQLLHNQSANSANATHHQSAFIATTMTMG